ncbi:MAG: hypothetical protein K5659_07755 [Lachnospiraceae bacterium]|nr:hypothetical protein [Lachnospiraceae bacterium]
MSSKSLIHQARLQEWATRCSDQKSSGLTVPEWCRQNNLSIHKFYYWKHLLKQEAINQVLPEIVPVSLPGILPETLPTPYFPTSIKSSNTTCTTRASNSCAIIQNGDITIELNSLASEDFITNLIKAVRNA